LGDELHRLVDLADHGLVVERVQGGELDQAEEGRDHVGRELSGVDLADVLARVPGEDVEPALRGRAGGGTKGGTRGRAGGNTEGGLAERHTTSPFSVSRLPILAAIASAADWARSRRAWLFHGRRRLAPTTAWSASRVRVSLPSSSAQRVRVCSVCSSVEKTPCLPTSSMASCSARTGWRRKRAASISRRSSVDSFWNDASWILRTRSGPAGLHWWKARV